MIVFCLDIMESLTLTKQQQKKALAGKKHINKTIRNVLASPYANYWPVLEETEETQLSGILESALQPAHQLSHAVPWSELKNVPRTERREKKRALTQPSSPESKELRQLLLLGVNALTRALERDAVACALLARDVDPPVLTRHIASMCTLHKVPLLVMHSLRNTTRSALGFACIALGFKKSVASASDNHFHALYLKIKELSAAFPWTEPMALFHNETLADSDDGDISSSKETEKTSPKPSADPYMYRSSRKERAYVPTTEHLHADGPPASEPSGSEFLALGSDSDSEIDSFLPNGPGIRSGIRAGGKWNASSRKRQQNWQSKVTHYKEPIIKRIRPNPNKVKKKKKAKKTTKL